MSLDLNNSKYGYNLILVPKLTSSEPPWQLASFANFDDAILMGSNLSDAFLQNTRLTDTNMANANLSGIDWSNSDISDALFCNTTMPDGAISNENCDALEN